MHSATAMVCQMITAHRRTTKQQTKCQAQSFLCQWSRSRVSNCLHGLFMDTDGHAPICVRVWRLVEDVSVYCVPLYFSRQSLSVHQFAWGPQLAGLAAPGTCLPPHTALPVLALHAITPGLLHGCWQANLARHVYTVREAPPGPRGWFLNYYYSKIIIWWFL